MKKFVYFFANGKADGRADMKDILGGKGANLAEMTNLGIPVPPGFTISTEVCKLYYSSKGKLPARIIKEVKKSMKRLEKVTGKGFGDPENPLLVSVRSGAKYSMPGMMDTILNLGLNDKTVQGLAKKTNNKRFAYDSYRRFIAMFGDVVLGIEKKEFEKILDNFKARLKVKYDVELTADVFVDLVEEYKILVKEKTGRAFPLDPEKQLIMAIEAVFRSWNNPRAIYYRNQYNISHDLGTAVNVQTMVFGNMGNTSATGVGFTRNPATGEKVFYGEYLINAQGEDVVAGIRTPKPISELKKDMPNVYEQLVKITTKLERHYKDVQDFEFTIEEGKLYMLQTRNGKRTAQAALKIAVDMVGEKIITFKEAIKRIEPTQLNQLLHPIIDPNTQAKSVARGLPASPGAACGKIVFNPDTAVKLRETGEKVILVRKETNPDDIHGMAVAEGFLTATGGMTSHAAVVARQMGKPCVVGCEAARVDEETRTLKIGNQLLREGEYLTINGSTGDVYIGRIPLIPPQITSEFKTFMTWVDQVKRLKVRANADTPRDAAQARAFGAEGIGLCRTEHMFFAEDRIPIMQKMIMASTAEERKVYLDKLLPMQKEDFKALYREMKGYPVTIRLLDPPLHEFLPKREELLVEITKLELTGGDPKIIEEKKAILKRVEELHEFNPMLGLRGCRLGIMYPEITEMQTRAIIMAACEVEQEGIKVIPEIMLPLISSAEEMNAQKRIVVETAEKTLKEYNKKIKYLVGTMIEVPRAALLADEIAKEAEFFSFGTNDLTQTTYGFSRDDAGKIIRFYLQRSKTCPNCLSPIGDEDVCQKCHYKITSRAPDIFHFDPFVTIDQKGIGDLMKIAIEKGRKTRKDIKLGICGEHGGDPATVIFCHKIGLDYVSCSPYRVPIARLAAAQAVLQGKK